MGRNDAAQISAGVDLKNGEIEGEKPWTVRL